MTRAGFIVSFWLAATLTAFAALGVFQGQVIQTPQDQDSKWLFVQSRNGNLRRVDISKAQVEYDKAIPAERRHGPAREALRPSVLVRVVADQDEAGEWQARNVVILSLEPEGTGPGRRASATVLTAQRNLAESPCSHSASN